MGASQHICLGTNSMANERLSMYSIIFVIFFNSKIIPYILTQEVNNISYTYRFAFIIIINMESTYIVMSSIKDFPHQCLMSLKQTKQSFQVHVVCKILFLSKWKTCNLSLFL